MIRTGGGDSIRAWVVYPERSSKAPVVLVVHEIFGLSSWIRGVADQLAADGFIAIAPDLLTMKNLPDGPDSVLAPLAQVSNQKPSIRPGFRNSSTRLPNMECRFLPQKGNTASSDSAGVAVFPSRTRFIRRALVPRSSTMERRPKTG